MSYTQTGQRGIKRSQTRALRDVGSLEMAKNSFYDILNKNVLNVAQSYGFKNTTVTVFLNQDQYSHISQIITFPRLGDNMQ